MNHEWSKTYRFVITHASGIRPTVVQKEVQSVTYYNVAGMSASTPFEGVNVVVTRYADGTTSITKRIIK